jgi:hypothetical protein
MLERFWGFFFIHKENQRMNYNDYQRLFNEILNGNITDSPYTDPHYLDYVKLNESRQNRWLKTGKLSTETQSTIQSIASEQQWLLITEPWCGDAAHSIPFIVKMAELNPLIRLSFQLRDSKESEINHYLTNGGKSIPILIVRDKEGKDLFFWGPRPSECQSLYLNLKASNASFEEQKVTLQQWYNENKGSDLQQEICDLLIKSVTS